MNLMTEDVRMSKQPHVPHLQSLAAELRDDFLTGRTAGG